jgi:hypothetical protein
MQRTTTFEGRTADAPARQGDGAVLPRVLELHPRRLTGRGLSLDLVGDTPAPAIGRYERAIRDLVAAGLLRADGDSIAPSEAALRADEVSS